MFFFIIRGEQAAIHPMVVWSEDGEIRSEHLLMVLCVYQGHRNRVMVRLEKGISTVQNKIHEKGRGGIHHDNTFQKRNIRDFLIGQKP